MAVCEDYLVREGGMKRDADGKATFPDKRKLRSAPRRLEFFERVIYPDKIAGRQLHEIKRSEVVKLLDKVEDERGPQAAHQALAFLSRLFSWYASRNDDFRSPIVRGMGRVKPRERARKRVLSDDEIRDLWAALDIVEDVPACYPRFVRSLLLCATRRTEAAALHSAEIDGDLWTIPGSRYKTKLDHVIPLTPQGLALIGDKPDGCRANAWFVFSTTAGRKPFSGYSKAKAALDAKIAERREAEGREPMPTGACTTSAAPPDHLCPGPRYRPTTPNGCWATSSAA